LHTTAQDTHSRQKCCTERTNAILKKFPDFVITTGNNIDDSIFIDLQLSAIELK
jgi:hypothetical protein